MRSARPTVDTTRSILDQLDYIGVAGIEFFVVGDRVLVNEMAPRVHNSGHWTQLGCAISQFEQHVRAITGRPLGDGAVLYNTLGHCRSHYDMVPMMDYWPTVDRCAWDLPVFYELLRRSFRWARGETS